MTDCKIMKKPEVYVGMHLERRQGLFIHQENFANKTLVKYIMTDCKIMKTLEVYVGMKKEDKRDSLYIKRTLSTKPSSNII